MNRLHKDCDWLPAFHALIERHRVMRYEWGVHDCGTVVREVLELSGRTGFPRWRNMREAFELLNADTLLGYAVEYIDTPIPWGDSIIGDVGIARRQSDDPRLRFIMTVFDGHHFIAPSDDIGFRRLLESDMLIGWRT